MMITTTTMIIKSDDVDDGHDEFYQLPNKTLEHPTDHKSTTASQPPPPSPTTGFQFTGFGSILGGSSPDQEVRKLKVNGTWKKWDPFPPTVWMVLKLWYNTGMSTTNLHLNW